MSDIFNSNNDGLPNKPPSDLIPYQKWIEHSHREVMLKALGLIKAEGLPTGHSFYITFATNYPGVIVPDRLRAQYPSSMTIVLQHQFWDLNIEKKDHILKVGLSFSGVPAKLVIPFGSITTFIDPAAQLSLVFSLLPIKQSKKELKDSDQPLATKAEEEKPKIINLDIFRGKK